MIKTKHDRTGSLEMKIVFVRFKSASSCFLNVFLFSKQFWIQLLMHWIQVVLRLGSRLQPKWDYSKSGICLKCIKKIVRPMSWCLQWVSFTSFIHCSQAFLANFRDFVLSFLSFYLLFGCLMANFELHLRRQSHYLMLITVLVYFDSKITGRLVTRSGRKF